MTPPKKNNKKNIEPLQTCSRYFRSKQNSFPPAGHLGHLDLWRVFWWHLESFAVDGNQKSGRLVGWEVAGGSLSHHLPGLMHPKWWFPRNLEQTNVGVDFKVGRDWNKPSKEMAMNLLQYPSTDSHGTKAIVFFPTFNTKLLTPCRHIDIDIPSSIMDLVTYGISRLQKLQGRKGFPVKVCQELSGGPG